MSTSTGLVAVIPPLLSTDTCMKLIQAEWGCTPAQARVVLTGVGADTSAEIASSLGISEATVRAHYYAFYSRAHLRSRNHVTALVVALLWQTAGSQRL